MKVVAIVWTFNPKLKRFKEVLRSISTEVESVIVVDNGSKNFEGINEVCNFFGNVILIRLNHNFGVRALNIGMEYAIKKLNPDFLLLLDQDTIVFPGAISKTLSSLKSDKARKVAIISISFEERKASCRGGLSVILGKHYGMFSGCLLRAEVIKMGVRIREEFFLDQADFDFYDKIKSLGFLSALYEEKLIDHELGKTLCWGKRKLVYEPPWRYYYIVRNSTVLLMEGKMDVHFYLSRLLRFAFPIFLVDGSRKLLRALTLGFTHGLFKKLGYFDPKLI